MAKITAKATTPGGIFQTNAKERYTQLLTIADKLLYQIHYGQCTASERSRLIQQYDAVDKILQRLRQAPRLSRTTSALNKSFDGMDVEANNS